MTSKLELIGILIKLSNNCTYPLITSCWCMLANDGNQPIGFTLPTKFRIKKNVDVLRNYLKKRQSKLGRITSKILLLTDWILPDTDLRDDKILSKFGCIPFTLQKINW